MVRDLNPADRDNLWQQIHRRRNFIEEMKELSGAVKMCLASGIEFPVAIGLETLDHVHQLMAADLMRLER
jgi:hypothetical protein